MFLKKTMNDVDVKGKRVFCVWISMYRWKMAKLRTKHVFVQQFQRLNN